jgi:hypothetical protein
MVVGDEQLLAETQVPSTETAAGCALKETAKTSAKRPKIRVEFKLTSTLFKAVLRVFRW